MLFSLQALEPRNLFSASVSLQGTTLHIQGTDAADTIRVATEMSGLNVNANGKDLGTFAADSLAIDTGAGDDTLLVLTSIPTSLVGGAGTDSVWAEKKSKFVFADADAVERKRGVNVFPTTFSSVGTSGTSGGQKVGAAVKDPKLTKVGGYLSNFSTKPLFSEEGPAEEDVQQGQLNDCFLLATLASIADLSPSLLRQTITEMGDGTFAVRIMHGKTAKYYRVDGDLPLLAGTYDKLAYAQLGAEDSTWVALIEKAYALDRGGSYTKLDKGGWMTDVYSALGVTAKNLGTGSKAITSLAAALASGKSGTLATKTKLRSDSPLIANHAYSVESVQFGPAGQAVSITLRNPWGYGGDDAMGTVTLPIATVLKAMSGIVVG